MTDTKHKHLDRVRTRHGKEILYYRPTRSHRYRLSSEPGTPAFDLEYDRAVEEHRTFISLETGKQPVRHTVTIEALNRKLTKCKARDRARGLETTITIEWLVEQLKNQHFCCSLTGIPFQVRPAETRVNPYSPSIDRIDSTKGYTPDNTRIVLYAINAMMMDWGDDVFRHVVSGFVLRNLSSQSHTNSLTSKNNK